MSPARFGSVMPFSALALAFVTVQVLEDTSWTDPLWRGGLLVLIAAGALLATASWPVAVRLASGLIVAFAVLGIDALLLARAGARSSLAEVGLLAVALGGAVLVEWRQPAILAAVRVRALLALLALAVLARVAAFGRYLSTRDLEDIAQTTIDALRAVLDGTNPYVLDIDTTVGPGPYGGYKYLPVTMLYYAPLAVAFDATGLRATNLLLDGATVVLAALVAARMAGREAGLWAALWYLAMPLFAADLFRHGVTDLTAVLPFLGALLLGARRPGLAGLVAGLAVSTKLFPGLFVLVSAVPRDGRRAYFAAAAVGLAPALAFAAWDPAAFARNILMFNLVRPPDSTSLPAALPETCGRALRVACGLAMVATAWVVVRAPRDDARRCALMVLLVALALIAGPTIHNNYLLWLWPSCAVVAAVACTRSFSSGRSCPG